MNTRNLRVRYRRYIDIGTEINKDGVLTTLSKYNIARSTKIPPIEIQQNILRHLNNRNDSFFSEKHGIFHTVKCTSCGTNMYIYMRVSQNILMCKSCYLKDRIKNLDAKNKSQKFNLQTIIKKINNVDAEDYDVEKNIQKAKNAYKIKNWGLIKLYSSKPYDKLTCKSCNIPKYYNYFTSQRKTKFGLEKTCSLCHRQSRNILIYKINNIITRSKTKNYEMDNNIVEIVSKLYKQQRARDYYTQIPFSKNIGSPFTPSPERIDRNRGYVDGNIVLCFQILNVGGNIDWTRKLTMQIYFASKFPTHYTDIKQLDGNEKVRALLNSSKSCSATRNKNGRVEAGTHSLTIDDILQITEKQNFRCALSKIPLVFKNNHSWMASIDRIDTTKGYHINNCRIVIHRLNSQCTWNIESWKYFKKQLDANIQKIFTEENLSPDNFMSLYEKVN